MVCSKLDFTKNKIILPDLISDNAIFQSGCPVRIWGYTDSREAICVTIIDDAGDCVCKAVGYADPDTAKFEIELSAVASGPMSYTLIIQTAGVIREINNILFGDVWVLSGQSNMEMKIWEIETLEIKTALLADEDKLLDNAGEIRFFCNTGQSDASIVHGDNLSGRWVIADHDSICDFSAVGYQMLKQIYSCRHCPLGGVLIAVGGSSIMSWIKGASYYQSKILPLAHMNIKGIAWYQGESDNRSTSPAYENYDEVLITLINDYREAWRRQQLPFLIVQLPLSFLYADRPQRYDDGLMLFDYEKIRMYQLSVYDALKDQAVYLVPTLDCGPNGKEKISIHFDDKIQIGNRLGLAALDVDNKKKTPERYTGARVLKASVQKERMKGQEHLKCDCCGQTVLLQFTDIGECLTTLDGEEPTSFYVVTASGRCAPIRAQIETKDSIRLQIPTELEDWQEIHYQLEMTDQYPFKETLPSGVKLFAKPNLVNSYGVPVMSFKIKCD